MKSGRAEPDPGPALRGRSGAPPRAPACGVSRGIKACARHRTGSDALAGKTVALQGCGSVTVFPADRKSTRLNSSHGYISYAVFCLKKKKKKNKKVSVKDNKK